LVALNHFTVPVAIVNTPVDMLSAEVRQPGAVRQSNARGDKAQGRQDRKKDSSEMLMRLSALSGKRFSGK
jgi:hypothetical protein